MIATSRKVRTTRPRPNAPNDPVRPFGEGHSSEAISRAVSRQVQSTIPPEDDDLGTVTAHNIFWCAAEEIGFQERDTTRGFEEEPNAPPGSNIARAVAASGTARDEGWLWFPTDIISYKYQQDNSSGIFTQRRERLEQVFREYASQVNLTFIEIDDNRAFVKVFFSDPAKELSDFCAIGRECQGYRVTRENVEKYGCFEDTTLCLELDADPGEKGSPIDLRMWQQCFHEVGHLLGLLHEHESPRTQTLDTPSRNVGIFTDFDKDSVMLYANRSLKRPLWKFWKEETTKHNVFPSVTDISFLMIIYPPKPREANAKKNADYMSSLRYFGITNTEEILRLRDFALEDIGEYRPRKVRKDAIKEMRRLIGVELQKKFSFTGFLIDPRHPPSTPAVEDPPVIAGPSRGIQAPPVAVSGPRPGRLFEQIGAILAEARVATSTRASVEEVMRKELGGISKEIAGRILEG